MPSKAERYWRQYLASLPADVDPPQTYIDSFSFGFNPRDASEIATLVIEGTKSATGSVLWSYEADGKPIPRTGDHSIVNDGHGEPVCILRTTAVSILPFDEVPEIYAFQGGEGDRTLATWRPMYWRYIVSECERIDREPSEKAPLVMERFTVVYCEPLLEPGTGPDGDAGGAGPMPDFYAEDLAYVHHVGFRGVPEAAARWLVAYLSRHDVPDGAVLDLACGSGVFAAGAARTGRPVLGMDASRAMVALARRTAPAARFEVGSIYEADLPECAVVAIIGEGLNYVPATGDAPALATTFGRVHDCLLRRGLFVFDVITGPIRTLVPRQSHRLGRDWAVLSETRKARQRDRFDRHITTFREVRGRYRRSEELHSIRVFERRRVAEALRHVGFTIRWLKAYERDEQLPGRIIFVAGKR